MSAKGSMNRAKFIASSAICAALYAIVNALTATLRTPWGVGEFRPGVVIPGFFALVAGPIPAAVGAAVGSFIGDMLSLVPSGASTPALALLAGAPGNFLGFLIIGYIFEKMHSWRGFILGTTSGLFVGNLWAAAVVVYLAGLPYSLMLGLLLFWFGTMFPFVVIFVPALVRYLRPYAGSLVIGREYPIISEPNRKVLWTWSILVAGLLLAAVVVLVVAQTGLVSSSGGALAWEMLFGVSAIAVLVVGAFIPQKPEVVASQDRSNTSSEIAQ